MLYIFCDCCGNYCYFGPKGWKIPAKKSNYSSLYSHLFFFPVYKKCILENSLRADAEYKKYEPMKK